MKKIRDDAWSAALSSDGAQIAFSSENEDQIWLMNADGGNAHAIIKADPSHRICCPRWFPGDKRLVYYKWQSGSPTEQVMESNDLKGADPALLLPSGRVNDAWFAEPGRLIYAEHELKPNQYDSNLWELRVDPLTGRPKSSPRRLTDWTGFNFLSIALTSDSKRLVFLKSHAQSDVYLLDLTHPPSAVNVPRRLTLSERFDWPGGWLDDKTVLFDSDRSGNFDIYKQRIDQRDAEPVVTGEEEKRNPQLSPDGKWVLYMQWPKTTGDKPPESGRIMRIPANGGPSETVLEFKGYSGGTGRFPIFACPRLATAACVLAERDGEQVSFKSFDPAQGVATQRAKIATPNLDRVALALSPDGSKIAISTFDYKAGEIQIVPLDGGTAQKFSAQPWNELMFVAWAADGKALFLTSQSSKGLSILRMPLTGHAELLFKSSWDFSRIIPSPDGRSLALGPIVDDANAWMIPSFPEK